MASFRASTIADRRLRSNLPKGQKSASMLLERDLVRHWSEDNGRAPTENFTAEPVHDRDQIQKSALHRDVGDINAPFMFTCPRGGPDLADQSSAPGAGKGKSYAAGVWRLIPSRDHAAHNPVAAYVAPFTARQSIAQQCLERVTRPIPRCFQELFVPSRQHAAHAPAGQWMVPMNRRFSALSPFGV